MPTRLPNPWGRSKLTLCAPDLTVEQKTWLIHEIKFFNVTCTDLAKRYGLDRKLLSKWVAKYAKNTEVIVKGGRPSIFGPKSIEFLKRSVSTEIYNRKVEDFMEDVQEEHIKNVLAATSTAKCSVKPVSQRSISRYMELMKVKEGNAEQTTDARAKATSDKINAISLAPAIYLMTPLTNAHLTINADGTSYQTGGGLTDKICIVYDPEEQAQRGTLKVMPVKGSSLTAYFVKFYLCMNATGTTAPPVYILADPNMREGTIDCHEVPGLGIGTELNSSGYIVFARTRSVNEAFYKWWFHTIFVPFVLNVRTRYKLSDEIPSFFTLDGEDTQIRPMQSVEVRTACSELNIIIGKPPASTTSISQPCDAGKCFIASKTKKKHLKKLSQILDVTMSDQIKVIIKAHEATVGKSLPAHHIKAICEGVQTVQYIISTTMRRDMIQESFEIVGQYDRATGGCNVERILGQCKSDFSTEEVTTVWEHLPRLCNIMKLQGELKEKDYLPLAIGEIGKGHDGLVLNRRRFVFLTNPQLIIREDQKRLDKVLAIEEKLEKTAKRKAAAEIRRAKTPAVKRVKKNSAVVVANIPV